MERRTVLKGQIPRAITIAGSDSGGCAGIQADLRTFAALGVHGMTAVTAVTAQDTRTVHAYRELPVDLIVRQIEVVHQDIGIDAAKTGMLSSLEIIRAVAETVERLNVTPLVVDPVMVSTGGDLLIRSDAVKEYRDWLIRRATVLTPNLHEAGVLVGKELQTETDVEEAAREIHRMGCRHVVIKGGHRKGDNRAVDLHFDGNQLRTLEGSWIDTMNTHGSGCTFAAAVTAHLAQGHDVQEALSRAKDFVTEAIRWSYPLGAGCGPLGHFGGLWDKANRAEE